MTHRLVNFESLDLPVIYHHLDLGMARVPELRQRLFTVLTSSRSQERGTSLSGFSPDAWDIYEDSGKSQKGALEFEEDDTYTYVHKEYPVVITIERRLFDDDQYGVIQDKITGAGMSAAVKMETDAASLLNLAFDSGKLWGDGKPLCATDHHSGNQSNKGTGALTYDNLVAARIAMQRFTDKKGNLIGASPTSLWVPPDLEVTARELVFSAGRPDTANRADNALAGRIEVVPWARLTDTNNWFLVDDVLRQQAVRWYERVPLEVRDFTRSSTEITIELYMRYSFGVTDWRWIYGSEVA